MADEDYSIERRSLHDLFRGNRVYVIPTYQRDYSWDDYNAGRLWKDLEEISTHQQNTDTNLLGAMVTFHKNSDLLEFEIVDGQQRMATLSLIFCAILRYLNKFTEINQDKVVKVTLDQLRKKLNQLLRTESGGIRVTLGHTDQEVFQKIITNDKVNYEEFCNDLTKEYKQDKKKFESHMLLIGNYGMLCESVEKWVEQFELEKLSELKDSETLTAQLNSMDEHLDRMIELNHFAFIKVHQEYTAFKIFNTFNSLGQKLLQADLVKSHLVRTTKQNKQKHDTMLRNWEKIFDERLEDRDTFLYESLLATNTGDRINGIKITKEHLHRIISEKYKNLGDIDKYMDQLLKDSKFMKQMDYPEDLPIGNKYEKLKSDFYGIKLLNARYVRVPILAAYRRWGLDEDDFKDLVDCLLKFFFKFKFINGGTAENVRQITSEVTKKILEKKKIKEIIKYILIEPDPKGGLRRRVDEKRFNEQFKEKMYKLTTNSAKYILASIETITRKNNEYEHFQYDFELEHILPINHKKYWNETEFFAGYKENGNQDEVSITKFKNRLGNLTLLSSKWNRGMGARNFAEKSVYYSKSIFEINKKFLSCDQWTAKEIIERENKLCLEAKSTWSLERLYNLYS